MSSYVIEFEVTGTTLKEIKRRAKAQFAELMNLENSPEALRPYPLRYYVTEDSKASNVDGSTASITYRAVVTSEFNVFPVLP